MAEIETGDTLYQQNDTGEYVEYTPPSFSESIPEDIRDKFEGVEDVGQLAQKYVEVSGQIPTKPESIDAYQIEAPEGMELNEELIGGLKEFAFENGIAPEQIQGLVQWYTGEQEKAGEEFGQMVESERAEAETALKKDWGDDYDKNLDAAKKVVDTFGDKDFKTFLNETGLGSEPALVKLFYTISSKISEDSFEAGGGGGEEEGQRDMSGRLKLSFPSMQE
jgi:hypothetical protein